jgi:hypothetical protein
MQIPSAPPYTAAHLAEAKRNLELWRDRRDNYDGNNLDKYQADCRSAQFVVDQIAHWLERQK